MDSDTYNSYDIPIENMRRLTKAKVPFSFSYVKEDGSIKVVKNALLRKMAKTERDSMGPYKLQYQCIDTGQKRSCYICALLSFNGTKILLQDERTQA